MGRYVGFAGVLFGIGSECPLRASNQKQADCVRPFERCSDGEEKYKHGRIKNFKASVTTRAEARGFARGVRRLSSGPREHAADKGMHGTRSSRQCPDGLGDMEIRHAPREEPSRIRSQDGLTSYRFPTISFKIPSPLACNGPAPPLRRNHMPLSLSGQ
jgi:hypothetical protein